MSPESRDWDKELAEIDRLMAQPPPAPARSAPPATGGRPAAPTAAPPRAVGKAAVTGAWFRALLGAALAVALLAWPAQKACGSGLALYGGAVGILVLSGAWSAVVSFRRQLGRVHVLSLLVLLVGLGLAAAEILPRVGYAKTTLSWGCD